MNKRFSPLLALTALVTIAVAPSYAGVYTAWWGMIFGDRDYFKLR